MHLPKGLTLMLENLSIVKKLSGHVGPKANLFLSSIIASHLFPKYLLFL